MSPAVTPTDPLKSRTQPDMANKNCSSWLLRPWLLRPCLLITHAGMAFDEVVLRLSFDAGSRFKNALAALAPTGKVSVLVDDGFVVWAPLAIAEYLAEKFPQHALWPRDPQQHAGVRSLCAEMPSG